MSDIQMVSRTETEDSNEKDAPATAADPNPPPPAGQQDCRTSHVESAPSTSNTDTEGEHHMYIFKRLRKPMRAPSKKRLNAIINITIMVVLIGTQINYLKMSLIYLMAFFGSISVGLGNVWITDRIGFGLATPLGALASAISYLLMGTGAHYALFLIAFVFNGFGLAIQDAQTNNLVSRLPGAPTKMMVIQACFGLGGMLAPLASTQFATHVERRSYLYFYVAMGVAIVAFVAMMLAFQMRTEEQIECWRDEVETEGERGHVSEGEGEGEGEGKGGGGEEKATERPIELPQTHEHGNAHNHAHSHNHDPAIVGRDGTVPPLAKDTPHQAAAGTRDANPKKVPQSSGAKMKRIFSTPAVYALMAFSFIYIGIEVAISAWSVTFLRRERGGSAAAGYVTTGFWGGMTVSRIVLIPVNNYLGYQFSIYLYSAIALALEIVIWFTHSLVGNGICFSFVGFFLGPVYPIALMVISEVLDDDLRGGVMALMGSMGGAGAAAVPFITGAISDKYGIWIIQPFAVAMIAAFAGFWALVPTKRKVAVATAGTI